MATTIVYCIHCNSDKVNKQGFQQGTQRYRCQKSDCQRSFILNYKNRGWLKAVKKQIVDMCINGSGIRDTARVLQVSKNTVIDTIKKSLQSGEKPLEISSI